MKDLEYHQREQKQLTLSELSPVIRRTRYLIKRQSYLFLLSKLHTDRYAFFFFQLFNCYRISKIFIDWSAIYMDNSLAIYETSFFLFIIVLCIIIENDSWYKVSNRDRIHTLYILIYSLQKKGMKSPPILRYVYDSLSN